MANQLPEVLPAVSSMPTTGWYCATSGKARRRIVQNIGSETESIYDVQGVPGYTHNASAVIAVDADYTKTRTRDVEVAAGVWGPAVINLPVGLLTDSDLPDNQAERYDRAIERCVQDISIRPENCTGHIREPARSIAEIRTLVAPKARLNTLTYVEERGGWRTPTDAAGNSTAMVSDFPDVYIDVRPLSAIKPATQNPNVTVSSLYLKGTTNQYVVHPRGNAPSANIGGVGPLFGEQEWDCALRFVWDDDQKLYKTLAPVTVNLHDVQVYTGQGAVVGGQGANRYDYDLNILDPVNPPAIGAGHSPRIQVTFPVLQTTPARDGYCWLIKPDDNEAALQRASRTTGKDIAPVFPVEVIGIQEEVGPFTWCGMPAYRIPVGSAFALPCTGVLQEDVAGATQTNFWDKADAFTRGTGVGTMDGFLRYDYNKRTAADVQGAPAHLQLAEHALNISGRVAQAVNPQMYIKRSAGALQQVCASYDDDQPNFAADARDPRANAAVLDEAGLGDTQPFPVYAQVIGVPGAEPQHHNVVFAPLQLTGTYTIHFPGIPAGDLATIAGVRIGHDHLMVPLTLEYYEYQRNLGPASGDYGPLTQISSEPFVVPMCIVAKTADTITVRYEMPDLTNIAGGAAGTDAYVRGYSLALPQDYEMSNVSSVDLVNDAALLNFFTQTLRIGSKITTNNFVLHHIAEGNHELSMGVLRLPTHKYVYFEDDNNILYETHGSTDPNYPYYSLVTPPNHRFLASRSGPIHKWDGGAGACRL